MATAYTDQVQKVYIAYYGRAADPVGLAYWAAKVETDGVSWLSWHHLVLQPKPLPYTVA